MAIVRVGLRGFTTFKTREGNPGNPEALTRAREKLKAEGYSGQLSQKAKSRIRRYVTSWLTARNSASGNAWAPAEDQSKLIGFATLTLPAAQMHTDNELKRLGLMPFIQVLKRKYGVREYLWKAEDQKNGNWHCHILFDVRIDHKVLRREWNKVLARLGYIEKYRQNQESWHRRGFRVRKELLKYWPEEKQRKAYKVGVETGWKSPNTTDIHALRKVKNVVAYVVKYISKSSKGRKLQGRLWECSESVRNLENYELELDGTLDALLKDLVRNGEAEVLEGDGFSFYRCNSEKMLNLYYPNIAADWVTHWQVQAAKLSTLAPSTVPLSKPPSTCLVPPEPDTSAHCYSPTLPVRPQLINLRRQTRTK